MKINTQGILYIVATPIGNRQDMTLRAIETLKSVDLIAAEDTRHSLALLQHLAVNKPLMALHEHNEQEQSEKIIQKLHDGQNIALISDAGTPLISDPGFKLVSAVLAAGYRIVPIPGACAAIAALSASGLPTDRFVFEGFLPAKANLRVERLEGLVNEPRTLVFYEAPHRIKALLADMLKVWGGERRVVIARELTKVYETIHSGLLQEVITWMEADANQQRGEMVVIVEGAKSIVEAVKLISTDEILKLLLKELPLKTAAEIASKISGQRKNELYQRALELKS